DANMANETVRYTTNMILSQSGTAMLAQANQRGQSVLQLLQ
ncbi:MAG: flagellin, partial [Treponema sp.]|nr:flagellin [Treponema sp.]